MRNLISENDIEQAILEKLKGEPFDYDILICDSDPGHKEDLNDGTFRSSKKHAVLPKVLKESLIKINPQIAEEYIDNIVKDLSRDFTGTDIDFTNYKLYNQIRNGVQITIRKNGKEDFEIVKLFDFEKPENNSFTAVSQMWFRGKVYWHRPDILIFVNGLPVVFIELKNSIVKTEEAYNKNLTRYKEDMPNLFAFNQICVLSNGLETKLGAFNSDFEYFFEWLKADSEKEILDREALRKTRVAKESSIKFFIDGLLKKDRLVDYIENFVLFINGRTKIIAKNHQYLGVNNLVKSVKNRKELEGKLGVFWHTQGSGKSFSMVMFARKVKRKIPGNFTFLVITDREDLDNQIHKNFVKTEVIGDKEECQPKNGKQLREYLQTNKSFIFTLIQKFRYDKKKETEYPLLSTRDDIIVLVDEAHRTQYKDLAENMRASLPNANYVAFTGTPLLGAKRLTNQWFGDYVSEYNFAQSVEDGSTVPLYYSRRVPEVGLQNNFLDDDVLEIIEDENLNEEETRLLENSTSKILEVIKREDRLDKIAQDIAHHFPRRGFLGKGMVVSVDKYTTVKMYEKVQHYWDIEKQNIVKERNNAQTKEERDRLTDILNYMNRVQMAVIISEDADETERFSKLGLDVKKHRDFMNETSPEGKNIEERFQTPNDDLQLVFVCAMWLTGFDVKNLSTLYLDKPMKGHTLMQAIARANRVYHGKSCGIIVDYVNVFKYMEKALTDYASGNDGTVYPAKDIDMLIGLIGETVDEAENLLTEKGINLEKIIEIPNVLDMDDALAEALDQIIDKDDSKDKFKVILNTLNNLYEASKPEIFEKHWTNKKFSAPKYMHGLLINTVDNEKIRRAKDRMAGLLDTSVTANEQESNDEYVIHQGKVIDISKIDVDKLREEIRTAQYKAIEIDDLKEYIEKALEAMINKNITRQKFSERFKGIIDRYNAGGSENEEYYEQLLKLIDEMKSEDTRAKAEGLTEEELEIFDLLIAGKKLTKEDEQKVKLSAKNLYTKLTENKSEILVVDWYKDEQPRAKVKNVIEISLDADLPNAYDKESFNAKTALLLNHFVDMAVQGYGWVCA